VRAGITEGYCGIISVVGTAGKIEETRIRRSVKEGSEMCRNPKKACREWGAHSGRRSGKRKYPIQGVGEDYQTVPDTMPISIETGLRKK